MYNVKLFVPAGKINYSLSMPSYTERLTVDTEAEAVEAMEARRLELKGLQKAGELQLGNVVGTVVAAPVEVSDEQIEALSNEAGEAGDQGMVIICRSALRGNSRDRLECQRVISANRYEDQ